MRSPHTSPCRERVICSMLYAAFAGSLCPVTWREHSSRGIIFPLTPFHWAIELAKIPKSILWEAIGIASEVAAFGSFPALSSVAVSLRAYGKLLSRFLWLIPDCPQHGDESWGRWSRFSSTQLLFGPLFSSQTEPAVMHSHLSSILSEGGKWLTPDTRTTTPTQFSWKTVSGGRGGKVITARLAIRFPAPFEHHGVLIPFPCLWSLPLSECLEATIDIVAPWAPLLYWILVCSMKA